ncbi:MAG: biopolymer transporter ExbD [Deltaproteobacteria bacterium]|nr:biopolymer transporter ExbD [Deltaproteobacteria bacterium]
MFSKFRKAKEAEDLNLIPIMNLMMTLIPFLLLGAAFYHIGVIPTSLPTHTPEGTNEPEKTEIVTLNLQVDEASVELSASASGLSEQELEALGGTFPRGKDGFDLPAIQAAVLNVKTNYPKSDTMIVLPSEAVVYQDLVSILDVTRERIIKAEGKDDVHEPLFPVTVFSRLIRPDPDAEGASTEEPAEEPAP